VGRGQKTADSRLFDLNSVERRTCELLAHRSFLSRARASGAARLGLSARHTAGSLH
jgi:hypothetical protein